MSRAARSVRFFGAYLVALGIVLLLVPNLLLVAFGFPESPEVWIRVVGLLAFTVGVYYTIAARCETRPFFAASVYLRSAVPFVFAAFVGLGLARPPLLIFGLVDLAGGLWTFAALRKDASRPSASGRVGEGVPR